ncbi:MAG: hypothetical protein CL543_04975 [Alcanivorax sp.]|nr:hypothetical protein [Alcanivorax sp.]MAY09327.1 hypothetical protein [Alcanivorax sp.]MBI56114.1 hypothetical protein [Alcanivorax sp.]MBU58208.1 hypothetical protein [Alcanivorax sp.]|tara:strand:- start:731 stop:1072 length:342 start_codon:yes stop_codon:yes gene_type:complete
MFGVSKKSSVTLREERRPGDYRFLGVTRQKNGDLVFEGQDLGQGVRDAFGCAEYEWRWTIKAQDVETLRQALGHRGDPLALLKKHFSGDAAAGLQGFLEEHGIPFESYSRIGD